jgi:beta-lactamase superfamily II metal-dependent hydrolase
MPEPPAVTIDVLPASYGDCLWVECSGPERPWRLLIDGGTPETWPVLRQKIENLTQADRRFDLVVASHIDSDHIGGLLPLFAAAPKLGVSFGDIWFNGLPQLPDSQTMLTRSVAEGESLAALLTGIGGDPPLPWNSTFHGFAVMTNDDRKSREISFDRGPRLTLLSPTARRLERLRVVWLQELSKLQRGESEEPAEPVPAKPPLDDLNALAAMETRPDRSTPNGSSIAFLLEHQGASCLFAADAFYPILGAALTQLANLRGGSPVDIDVFKLPHHASKGNVASNMLRLAPARHYIVSTNGERFHHPDDIALSRVVTSVATRPALWFNYENETNRRWQEASLQRRYQFTTKFPADSAPGVRLQVPARRV